DEPVGFERAGKNIAAPAAADQNLASAVARPLDHENGGPFRGEDRSHGAGDDNGGHDGTRHGAAFIATMREWPSTNAIFSPKNRKSDPDGISAPSADEPENIASAGYGARRRPSSQRA